MSLQKDLNIFAEISLKARSYTKALVAETRNLLTRERRGRTKRTDLPMLEEHASRSYSKQYPATGIGIPVFFFLKIGARFLMNIYHMFGSLNFTITFLCNTQICTLK